MNINPGRLNKRIEVIAMTKAEDADGYSSTTETVVHSCWASFQRMSGSEVVKSDADFTKIRVRFVIRATKKPIDRKMIVRYGGEDYEITYINEYNDSLEYTEIWCTRTTLEGR